jgi:hypothetical protein
MTENVPVRPNTNSFLIPFVIGVTGHRDLREQDIPILERRVRSVLDDFRRRLPSTPVLLLSALAGGADQLVARIAVQCEFQLVAVLPMPIAIYRSQMEANAQRTFDELLAKSSLVLDLPLNGMTEAELRESEETRAEAYDALGRFLVGHSQALVALWDGTPSTKKGGTARVVDFMLNGTALADWSEGEPRTGMVYQILTPRAFNPAPEGEIFGLRLLTSLDPTSDKASEEFTVLEQRLEAFNKEATRVDLAAAPHCGNLVPEEFSDLLLASAQRVSNIYFAADKRSLDFNDLTAIVLLALLIFAFVAIGSFEIYAHVLPQKVTLWLVYPIALLGAWLTYRYARKNEIETKYFDYRALAEALRVQFFWSLAGIKEAVADHYLRDHRTELDWIRYALCSISVYENTEEVQKGDSIPMMELILKHWVEHQANWYSAKSKQQQNILRRLDNISGRSLFVVWLVSILVPLSLLIPYPGLANWRQWALEEPYHGLLILLVPLPSLAIGLFRVWVEQAGYDVQARKYHRMAKVFRRAADRLKELLKQKRIEDVREILRRLGMDALEENGDWLLLHREHPLRVVGAA